MRFARSAAFIMTAPAVRPIARSLSPRRLSIRRHAVYTVRK
jgi:hypothetical protein